MHPNKFFNEANCRTGIDIVEVYDTELKHKLQELHPLNFIKSNVTFPTYRITMSYLTDKGNYKDSEKYMVMNSPIDDEYADTWADMFARDYAEKYNLKELQITDIKHICDAVLPIG